MSLATHVKHAIRAAAANPAAANEIIDNLNLIDGKAAAGTAASNALVTAYTSTCTKFMGGVIALDGSGATVVATGLTTILAATVTYEKATSPGLDPSMITCTISGGNLSIWPWKVTGAGDATLIASTNTGNVHWIVVGV
jgi:hypothetical protein